MSRRSSSVAVALAAVGLLGSPAGSGSQSLTPSWRPNFDPLGIVCWKDAPNPNVPSGQQHRFPQVRKHRYPLSVEWSWVVFAGTYTGGELALVAGTAYTSEDRDVCFPLNGQIAHGSKPVLSGKKYSVIFYEMCDQTHYDFWAEDASSVEEYVDEIIVDKFST